MQWLCLEQNLLAYYLLSTVYKLQCMLFLNNMWKKMHFCFIYTADNYGSKIFRTQPTSHPAACEGLQWITYAWGERVVPRPSLASHTSQYAAAMETVARITVICDHAASKVALVTDFGSKLRHTRFVTMRKFKTWRRKASERKISGCF